MYVGMVTALFFAMCGLYVLDDVIDTISGIKDDIIFMAIFLTH